MKFRFLAGVLTLLALTAVVVQGLWASTCGAEMGMPVAMASSVATPSSAAACPAEMVQLPASSDEGSGSDAPHCPWMPLGMASSCVGVVALPAESFLQLEPSIEDALLNGSPDHLRDLLLPMAFFRPPIA
jgi:hypothetical protein